MIINILLYFSFTLSSFSILFFILQQISLLEMKEDELLLEEEDNNSSESDSESLEHEIKSIPYEEKYLDKVRNKKTLFLSTDPIEATNINYENLLNNFILEKTPIGNVCMFYDFNSETFSYYSDHSIPYRYLEVVAQKYVLTYECVELYIDMQKEIEIMEEKTKMEEKKEQEEKTRNASLHLNNNNNIKTTIQQETKNVFAKFKNYNKEGMSGRVNSVPPPKNSLPNRTNSNTSNTPFSIKDKANRYVCKGRFSNFSLLKSVKKKEVLSLNYHEYKKKMLETAK
jgi:hypothetical protein